MAGIFEGIMDGTMARSGAPRPMAPDAGLPGAASPLGAAPGIISGAAGAGCPGASVGSAPSLPVAEPVRIRAGVQCHCPLPDCIVFLACSTGRLTVSLGGGASIRLREGDACLMPARSQYCIEAKGGDAGAEIMLSIADLTGRHAEVVACSPRLSAFIGTEDDLRPLLFRGFYDAATASLVEGMYAECEARDLLYRESLECAVRQLAISLARAADGASRAGGSPLTAAAVTAYLEANLETATLASTARHFAYHPNTVAALIRRETGKTFGELVTELRMARAEELVARSSIPVQRLAEACGYRNLTHFYDLFRRTFGCTPGEYRAALAA